ncbi:hypothetical protein H2248_011943 [Termitomyces sp. 'cryptogamus']|nr:hypothetical protein H2248_011943 [Termitomyces sp. 'cryptogamus']
MKFARYLDDTQTPEWKKAYIDYRGLKKCITAIRKEHEGLAESSGSEEEEYPVLQGTALEVNPQSIKGLSQQALPMGAPVEQTLIKSCAHESLRKEPQSPPVPLEAPLVHRNHDTTPTDEGRTLESQHAISFDHRVLGSSSSIPGTIPTAGNNSTTGSRFLNPKSLTSLRGRGRRTSLYTRHGVDRPATNPMERLPLNELLLQLEPIEKAFFIALDKQLDKIDCFYSVREAEFMARTKVLHEQLDELGDHKELVKSVHPHHPSVRTTCLVNISKLRIPFMSPAVDPNRTQGHDPDYLEKEKIQREGSVDADVERTDWKKKHSPVRHTGLSADPEDYLFAKKKLKKAVLEHYRGLEVLQNYRVRGSSFLPVSQISLVMQILNLTGFRKALKKFEKSTKIQAQRQYMSEKVERAFFASGKNLQEMMVNTETLYAARFARGDRKRARTFLRTGFRYTSHHFSVFRSGILLGVAIPAFVSGLCASFQQSTRDDIPAWDALLFLYGVFLIPILLLFLVGINLLVWARARINYVFIFELDTRTRMDYREYFEIPTILLAALCWAFWLSFRRVGSPHILPQYWLLVWLGFCAFVVLEPLTLFCKSSRYWFIRKTAKLLISGTRRVEFADFWMGDQYCSLVFTISNLYFFVCLYTRKFDEGWSKCGVSGSPQWPAMYVLASLPFYCRFAQSAKRYYDSGLITHLINGGKYFVGIISYLLFYLWRQKGSHSHGSIFVLWIFFNTIYSIYASTWDLLMDWSVLRPRGQYPLLREELIYSDSIPLYYFAMITNVLIRFIWVIYIPHNGPSMYLRTFICALLEVLRRWQWNFYRLENEHLGNMDQYRVTREVPLPYSFDHTHAEDADNGDDGDDQALQLVAVRERDERISRARKASSGRRAKKGEIRRT